MPVFLLLLLAGIESGKVDTNGDFVDLFSLGLADKVIAAVNSTRQKVKEKKEKKGNIKEYGSLIDSYKKLSEGKVGSVESYKDEKSGLEIIVIHTENGPFVKTKQSGNVVLLGSEDATAPGIKISYTGLREVEGKDGKKEMAFIKDVSFSQSKMMRDHNFEERIAYRVGGEVLTEGGERKDLSTFKAIFAGDTEPTGESWNFVYNVAKDFDLELKKARENQSGDTQDEK